MDIENHLRQNELAINSEQELKRILECHPKDYFAILQINPLNDPDSLLSQTRKQYRKKSLLLHPDKVKHQDAPRAFDLVKKAEMVLSATEGDRLQERENLVELYNQIDASNEEKTESFESAINEVIREKVKQALRSHEKQEEVEMSYQRRQDAQRNTEVINAAKEREFKKQWEKEWENQRDSRVKLWRDFSSKVTKKKKTKRKVLA